MADGGLSAVLIAAAVSAAVSTTMSLLLTKQNGQKDQGVTIETRGKNDPKIIAFGDCRVPASRVFANVNDNKKRWLVQSYSLGWGPIQSVEQVYIDEIPYFKTGVVPTFDKWYDNQFDENGERSASKEYHTVQMGLKAGLPIEGAPFSVIVNNSDGNWTDAHRGHRTAQLHLMADRGIKEDVRFVHQNHEVQVQVKGNSVIDPRVDSTLSGKGNLSARVTTSYRNPACVLLTYMLDPHFGMNLPVDCIDITSFWLLANHCDANKIYFDGWVSADDNFGKVITNMATAFRGLIYVESGKVKVKPLEAGLPVVNVTEGDHIGNISVSNNNDSNYFNAVKIDFYDKTSDYNTNSFVLPAEQATDPQIAKDGRVVEKTISYPFNTDPELIKVWANRDLKQAKLCRKTLQITLNNLDYKLTIGDLFTIENELYDLDQSTVWRVEQVETTLDDKALHSKIKATQYHADVYDDSIKAEGVLGSALPVGSLIVPPVTNLTFTQGATKTIGSGTLNWWPGYAAECRYIVDYRLTGTTGWETYIETPSNQVVFSSLQAGRAYDFRVMTQSTITTSEWVELLNQNVARSVVLPAVTGLTGTFTSRDARITWTPIAGAVTNNSLVGDGVTDLSQLVSHYAVTVNGRTYTTTEPWFEYTYDLNAANGLNRVLNVSVRGVSVYSDLGSTASLQLTNAAPAQPSGVAAYTQLMNLYVTWNGVSDADYIASDVYIVPDTATQPTTAHKVGQSDNASWSGIIPASQKTGYVVVVHRDAFGAGPLSSHIQYTQTTIDDLLTDSASFPTAIDTVNIEIGKVDGKVTNLSTDLGGTKATLQQVQGTVSGLDTNLGSLTGTVNSLSGRVGTAETNISNVSGVVNNPTTGITALNQSVTGLTNTTNGQSGKITSLESVTQSLDGNIKAIKSFKLDVNNKVSGLILGNTGNTSTVDFLTDVFRVGPAENMQSVFEIRNGKVMMKTAFIGDLSADTITSGTISANRIAAGTIDWTKLGFSSIGSDRIANNAVDWSKLAFGSIDSAHIDNGAITSAKIGDGAVNGAKIPDGAIVGKHIFGEAITGGHISAASDIKVGSNNNVAHLSGSDPTYRIWAGNNVPVSAPFRVTQAGQLIASNANITGAVTATSGSFASGTFNDCTANRLTVNAGTFNNVTIAENCTVRGTVYADKIVGDVSAIFKLAGTGTAMSYSKTMPVSAVSRTIYVTGVKIGVNFDDWSPSRGSITVSCTGRPNQVFSLEGGATGSYSTTHCHAIFKDIPAGESPTVTITIDRYANDYSWEAGVIFWT